MSRVLLIEDMVIVDVSGEEEDEVASLPSSAELLDE